jgi:hypothetical protein
MRFRSTARLLGGWPNGGMPALAPQELQWLAECLGTGFAVTGLGS